MILSSVSLEIHLRVINQETIQSSLKGGRLKTCETISRHFYDSQFVTNCHKTLFIACLQIDDKQGDNLIASSSNRGI